MREVRKPSGNNDEASMPCFPIRNSNG